MGVPLILVAVGGARFLPKSGPWLNASKFIFGMLLLSVSVWLISRIIPGPIALGLWAMLALATSVYMGAFDQANTNALKFKKTAALLIFVVSCIWLVGAFSGASHPAKPFEYFGLSKSSTPNKLNTLNFTTIKTIEELNVELERAQSNNQIAFLDVYADWCISCIIMEREIFPKADIHALLSKMHLIKADVTRNDAGNVELMKYFELFGPPSYLFFDTTGNELINERIVGEISKDKFLARLQTALNIGS